MDEMSMKPRTSRRATILILVVSLLALLFVIVTGFLSLARVDRQMLGDVRQADLTDAILEDTDDWVESLIVDQLAGDTGQLFAGGGAQSCSYEDIYGYRGSRWLAALEPVRDEATTPDPARFGNDLASGGWGMLEYLHWPAVTSLDGSLSSPEPFALYELMRDYDFTQIPLRVEDVQWNARNPFMDADGDGVPDSHFLLCGPAIQAANAAAGTPVQVPRFVSNDPGDVNSFVPFYVPRDNVLNDYRDEKWRRYDENARYEVAVRVISHGGMVTLDAPTLYGSSGLGQGRAPFNREFAVDLFDAIRKDADNLPMRFLYGAANEREANRLFDELHANAREVEPLLRRRFLLPGYAEQVGTKLRRQAPPILAELQGELQDKQGFPATLIPVFQMPSPVPPNNWQRVNLGVERGGLGGGSVDEREGWAQAVACNPTEYNTTAPGTAEPQVTYDRRHLVTTVNYSDELARKQVQNDPQPSSADPLDLNESGQRGSTYQGELKYYLGEVTKAFDVIADGQYQYDRAKGDVIIEELARRYFDMLASHADSQEWGDLTDNSKGKNEVVKRRQQALMLAVNTVAFAAPRDTDKDSGTRGWIDPVSYTDGVIEYTGYAPQPFFTEVVAYMPPDPTEADDHSEQDPLDPTPPPAPPPAPDPPDGGGDQGDLDPEKLEKDVAIAIEIYNPNDPYYKAGDPNDVFALNLSQFAITIDQTRSEDYYTDPGKFKSLAEVTGRKYLRGREFLTIVIKDSKNATEEFDPPVTDGEVTTRLERYTEGQQQYLNLSLRRISKTNPGFEGSKVIDRIQIERPEEDKWEAKARDTSPVRYFNHLDLDGDGQNEYARWNMVLGHGVKSNGTGDEGLSNVKQVLGNAKMLLRNVVTDPDIATAGDQKYPFSPTTPLVTMNAAPFNDLAMFGNGSDLRPRSFPTVGFMLFIPRYSHAEELNADEDDEYHPISKTLDRQWSKRNYPKVWTSSRALGPTEYPADFGHMPIFDNTQPVVDKSYLDEVGRVPWGLLVFDYFTTLNPLQDRNEDDRPDVDPLRVPGRINVNTAPWYVLANLPVLGPVPNDSTGALPIYGLAAGEVTAADPAPSFWDPYVGVLVGQGYDPNYPLAPAPPVDRLLLTDRTYSPSGRDVPWIADNMGRYRLGPWLAQAAAAYRDGIQYVEYTGSTALKRGFEVYVDSHLRNPASPRNVPKYRDDQSMVNLFDGTRGMSYGRIRGRSPGTQRPTQFGFITLGELLNVQGFDSSNHESLRIAFETADKDVVANTTLTKGDFVKAVSLLALLDTQYLTTRSNTFTIYTSVMDREDPESSMRSQLTVDRSNLLPRLTYAFYDPVDGYYPLSMMNSTTPPSSAPSVAALPVVPLLLDLKKGTGDPGHDNFPETPVRMTNQGARPEIIAREQIGYFNARYDD
jgi:hypothetical protein